MALSKVHANEETFRPVLPHLSATLTSLLRSVVCSSAPERASAARHSELCCELAEPRGIGTISNGTNGMANNPQDKERNRIVKPRSAGWPRTRCTRSDWTTEYPQNMMMPAVGKGAPFPQPPLPPPDTPMDGPHDMATNQPMQFVPQLQADAVFHILMGAITSILRQWILTQEECTQLLQTAQIDAPIVVWSDDLAMVWATPGCFEESHGDYQHEVCGVWF